MWKVKRGEQVETRGKRGLEERTKRKETLLRSLRFFLGALCVKPTKKVRSTRLEKRIKNQEPRLIKVGSPETGDRRKKNKKNKTFVAKFLHQVFLSHEPALAGRQVNE